MVTSALSTIAQVLCHETVPLNFARLVGDVDGILENALEQPVKARWDRETTVSFDSPGTRIIIDWTEDPGQGLAGVLTLSVGPGPMEGKPVMRPAYHALCKKLVALCEERLVSSGVLWRQLGCALSADWMELLVEALPDLSDLSPPKGQATQPGPMATSPLALPVPLVGPMASDCAPSRPASLQDPDMVRVRSALYDREDADRMSNPMRLAVHAMNATLIMVWMPLGAAAMAYGVVKGEDMRRASHLMVLTGLGSAVSQTPMGQQLLAMLPML